MASIRSYPNGAGGSSGAALATSKPTFQSGNYWYVGNTVPGNSDSNAGKERTAPLATVGQANTNASAGDTVIILSGHSETVSTAVTFKTGMNIVGEGSGSSVPRFTNGVAAATNAMFIVSAASVLFDNLYFPASPASARERIQVIGGSGLSILQHLTFDCGANDAQRTLSYDSIGPDFAYGLTFRAVASGAAQAIQIQNATSYLTMDTVTMDGGSFGWGTATTTVYAFSGTQAMTDMRLTNFTLLNGSHMQLATGTTGTLQLDPASGDSRVDWTP